MNYKLHYERLIERAKDRKLDCYTESHHIVPKSMNGNDDKDNLVNLTAREHFVAHILLVKIYPEHKGLINAVNMMTVTSDKIVRNNRMYGWLKEKFSERMSELQTGSTNSQYGTIWICNIKEEINKKIKKPLLETYIDEGWITGRSKWKLVKNCRNCNEEFISEKANFCDRKCHTEFRRKEGHVSPMKGKKHTKEAKEKIANSNRNRTGIKYKVK